MGNYVSKFGFYEFLALLVPGTVFTQCLLFFSNFRSFILEKLNTDKLGTEEYVIICIVGAFVVGLILQELGTLLDECLFYNIYYGSKPSNAWVKNCLKGRHCVIKDHDIANKAKHLCSTNVPKIADSPDRCFYYMVNTLEANGVEGKEEKMMIASELSRSLALGSAILMLLHLAEVVFSSVAFNLLYVICLIGMILLFTHRKIRYEQFRYSTVIRTFVILHEDTHRSSHKNAYSNDDDD